MDGIREQNNLFCCFLWRRTTMGIFTKDIKPMEDLFLHQLEDIHYAERQLTRAMALS